MTRHRIGLFTSYWMRVLRQATSEALHRWFLTFGAAAGFTILAIVLGASALRSLLVFVVVGFIFLAWFLLTIPPRIESETQQKEATLRVLSERRNMANELRNHMIACRMSAQEARAVAIEPQHRGMTPDTFHQRALMAVEDAEKRLQRFGTQTGQMSHESHILELTDVVSADKCASFDDAIAQLEALAHVLERQLSTGLYW